IFVSTLEGNEIFVYGVAHLHSGGVGTALYGERKTLTTMTFAELILDESARAKLKEKALDSDTNGQGKNSQDHEDPDDPYVRLKHDCVAIMAAFKIKEPYEHYGIVVNSHIYCASQGFNKWQPGQLISARSRRDLVEISDLGPENEYRDQISDQNLGTIFSAIISEEKLAILNEQSKGKNGNKSFANITDAENKLSLIPMSVEEGREVVIFYEELVLEVRMSGKFGLKEIVSRNGVFLFKFREIDGLNHVLENGPWMVIIDRREPKVMPCWIKLYNVPLETWIVKGISAIASGLGKPLIVDKTTTRMCKDGTGNIGYARVLVEINADKEFKENIEICYKSDDQKTNCSKFELTVKTNSTGQKGNDNRVNGQEDVGFRRMIMGEVKKRPRTLMAKLGFDRNILSTVLNNTNANGPIAFHITPIGPAHPAEPLGVNGSTGPTVLSDGPKSGFAGSVGAIGSDGTLGSIGSARRELGPHGQTTRQETILPNPLHAMTLQDPATGNWNIDTGASSHLNDSVSSFSDIFNMSIYPSVSVGDGHSIPITNSDHSILPTPHRPLYLNNVLITPNIHSSLTGWMLRCDSTGDLYPVTKPSTVPNAFFTSQYTSHQRLRHPGSEVLRRVLSSISISFIEDSRDPSHEIYTTLGVNTRMKDFIAKVQELSENFYPNGDNEPLGLLAMVSPTTPGSAITIPETANEFAIKEILKNEVVRLMMFPLSLTGEAKTWLDELNEGTIETWDEL
ncbi:ribonuclease H-like domain-containing protein, partial [Tanacetum coccineum]